MTLPGHHLDPSDLAKLAACGIPAGLAEQALLRRVDSIEGAQLVGRNGSGDYAGIAIPNVWPSESYAREFRLRRDRPPLQEKNGEAREQGKYLSAPGRGNLLYFVPGTQAQWLTDVTLPLVVSEGEKKTIALWTAAWHGASDASDRPAFVPMGLAGVWNWRGTIGKATGPDGDRRDVRGPIADLARIQWANRKVTIVYDVNLATNDSVRAARQGLTYELHKRGAHVYWFEWPTDTPAGVNGIDDLLGLWGVDRVWDLIRAAAPWKKDAEPQPQTCSVSEIPSIRVFEHVQIEWVVDGLIAEGTVNLLSGESGCGKSTLALALAGAVATGSPFLGRRTARRPVLYLDRENPLAIVVERFDRLNLEDGDTFKVWGGWCEYEAPDPASPTVEAWVRTCEPRPLIVVDSLVAFHPGSENDAAETRAYLHHYRQLANLGGTLVALHHTGKAETAREFRGSSDIKGAVDSAYLLAGISDAGVLDRLRLRAFKSRFAGKNDILLRYADGRFSAESETAFQGQTNSELLTQLLQANSGITGCEFETEAGKKGLGRRRARTWLRDAVRLGRVRVDKGPGNVRYHHWAGDLDDGNELFSR